MTPRQVQVLIGLGALVAVLLIVLIAVLVVGGDDDTASSTSLPTTTGATAEPTSSTTTSSTTTSASTSTSSSTSTSTTTSTSATTSTSTTTLPPGACPGAGAGPPDLGASISVRLVEGDFDGDGAQDRFLVYEDSGGDYRARVELSYGYAAEAVDPVPGGVMVDLKSVDLGGTADLGLTELGWTSSSRLATFYVLDECELRVPERGGGAPAQFPLLGAPSDELAGVTCTAEGILVTGAQAIGGGDWEVSSVTYVWDSAARQFQGTVGAAAVLHWPEDDEAILSHADWDC